MANKQTGPDGDVKYKCSSFPFKQNENTKSNTTDKDSKRSLGNLRFLQPSFSSISVPSVE